MKTLILCLLLTVAFCALTESQKVTYFNQWAEINNKHYPNEDVEFFRF